MRYDRTLQLEDGRWQLEYVEVPDWARRLTWLFEQLDHYSGHLLCGQGWPDCWLFYPLISFFWDVGHYCIFLPYYQEQVLATSDPFEIDDPDWAAALESLGPLI